MSAIKTTNICPNSTPRLNPNKPTTKPSLGNPNSERTPAKPNPCINPKIIVIKGFNFLLALCHQEECYKESKYN